MNTSSIITRTAPTVLSVRVSGGELTVTHYATGKIRYWLNAREYSRAEFRRMWALKRPRN